MHEILLLCVIPQTESCFEFPFHYCSNVYKFMEDDFMTLVGIFPLNVWRAVKQGNTVIDLIFLITGNHLISICSDPYKLLS